MRTAEVDGQRVCVRERDGRKAGHIKRQERGTWISVTYHGYTDEVNAHTTLNEALRYMGVTK